MCNSVLKKGDKVKIVSVEILMKILIARGFCSDDVTRQRVANQIGGKEGVVTSIEEKWQFDYFYFTPTDGDRPYSVPYEAFEFVTDNL